MKKFLLKLFLLILITTLLTSCGVNNLISTTSSSNAISVHSEISATEASKKVSVKYAQMIKPYNLGFTTPEIVNNVYPELQGEYWNIDVSLLPTSSQGNAHPVTYVSVYINIKNGDMYEMNIIGGGILIPLNNISFIYQTYEQLQSAENYSQKILSKTVINTNSITCYNLIERAGERYYIYVGDNFKFFAIDQKTNKIYSWDLKIDKFIPLNESSSQ